MNRVVRFLAIFALAAAPVAAAAPVSPLAPQRAEGGPWMPITSASPLAIRVKRRLGLYTGIGVKVPLSVKAKWYFHRYGVARSVLGVSLAIIGLPAVSGFVMPTPKRSVWAGGLPREWVTVNAKVKTVTSLKAGVFVERDTTNDEIKVATAGSAVVAGVLTERNWTQPDWDPTTAPTAADLVEVVMMVPGTIVRMRNATATLTYGALLNSAAAGLIATAAVAAAGDIPKVTGKLMADSDGTTETDALVVLGF